MHPTSRHTGLVLPGIWPRSRFAILLVGLAAALFGCNRPADKETVRETAPIRDERVSHAVAEPNPNRPLTTEELARKKQLETELVKERPTHRLHLRDGRVLDGSVVSATPFAVRFRDAWGYSGYFVESYRRADIQSIETLAAASYEVTPRDVRFSAEFSQFHFVKCPPYTIVTDESYGEVQKILAVLTDLREQFHETFGSLIKKETDLQDIDVVFFGSENAFREYALRVAPSFVNSAGFFSSGENRLALLNQLGTSRYAQAQGRLDDRSRRFHGNADVAPQLAALRSDIASEVKSMNERLVRHEGAHQLFHAYGIHSRFGLEPTWLTEGLAQYCETADIGHYHRTLAERVLRAQKKGQLLPLQKLLNHRNASGFFALGEGDVELAYAESWSLVYMLMEPRYRAKFFNYVKSYRDAATYRDVTAIENAEPEKLLEAQLKTDLNTLQHQWDSFITHM